MRVNGEKHSFHKHFWLSDSKENSRLHLRNNKYQYFLFQIFIDCIPFITNFHRQSIKHCDEVNMTQYTYSKEASTHLVLRRHLCESKFLQKLLLTLAKTLFLINSSPCTKVLRTTAISSNKLYNKSRVVKELTSL